MRRLGGLPTVSRARSPLSAGAAGDDIEQWGWAMKTLLDFLNDEGGSSAAEYALILAIIGIGIVAAASFMRDAISGAMTEAANHMNNAS